MSPAFWSRSWRLIAALVGLSACSEGSGSGSGVEPPTPVSSVIVDPPYQRIEPGEVAGLGASPRAETGEELSGRTVTWRSLEESVATVTTSGVVSAVAPGLAVITASSEDKHGTAVITVLGPVGRVAIQAPRPYTLLPGEGVVWQAEVRDTGGNVLQRSPVGWSSSDTTVATVDRSGHVAGVAAGTAEIAATAGGVAGKVLLTVDPLADLKGAWAMAEEGGCVASGPVTLTQNVAGLSGQYEPKGTCHLLTGGSIDKTGTRNVNGTIAGSQVTLSIAGALVAHQPSVFCQYRGTIEGAPASRIQGTMECLTDDYDLAATGTFTMTR